MTKPSHFKRGDRVRWLWQGYYRIGTVVSVGNKYVHVHADVAQRPSRRSAFTHTVSLRPDFLDLVEREELS